VELFTDVGSSGDNFTNTTLDDEALYSIADITNASPRLPAASSPRACSRGGQREPQWCLTLEITDDASPTAER